MLPIIKFHLGNLQTRTRQSKMEPIGTQASGIVKVDTIPKWNETEIPQYSVTDLKKPSKFPWRPDLNRKIALW